MAWTLLVVAGFFEIVWAILLKFSDGFTRMWPSVGTVVAMGISMVCMSFALRDIPMGTAYVVWTGIGAVGTVILGMVLFDEPKNVVRHGDVPCDGRLPVAALPEEDGGREIVVGRDRIDRRLGR